MSAGLISGLFESSHGTAETPSHINVNLFRWLSFRPWLAFGWIGALVASVGLSFVSTLGGALFGVLLLIAAYYWFRIWKFFWHGCLIPALAVSEDPPLVAAYSNLSQVAEFLPHVKVQHVRLGTVPKLGQRVVAVGQYVMPIAGHNWVDFNPVPLTQATASTGIQAAAEAKLGEDSWQLLEVSLASLPQPITPGLYAIDPKLFAPQMLIASDSRRTSAKKVGLRNHYALLAVVTLIALGVLWYLKSDPYGNAIDNGDTLVRIGKYEQAASYYQQAIHIDANNPIAYFHRAVAYQRSANHMKAQMDFDEVLRLRPDFGPGYRMRALSMQAQRLKERYEADQAEADRLGAPKTITEPFAYEI